MDVGDTQEPEELSSPDRGAASSRDGRDAVPPVVFERRSGVTAAKLDGETSLFDGTNTALVLNETATAIWQELAEPVTLAELVERLTHRFQVPEELVAGGQIASQVSDVLTDLGRRGLVTPTA